MDSDRNSLTVSNNFIESVHKTSLTEKKILNMIAHHIRQDPFEDNLDYFIRAEEILPVLGKCDNAFRAIDALSKKIGDIEFGIKDEEQNYFSYSRVLSRRQFQNGILHLTVSPGLKNIFQDLKKGFTRLRITCIRDLKSVYIVRLYELLKEHLYQGHLEISLYDLKILIGCDNLYKNYTNFKMRILDPAQDELIKKSDISFTYQKSKKAVRSSKKEIYIYFNIIPNQCTNEIINLPGLEFDPSDISDLEVDLYEHGFRGDFGKLTKYIGYDAVKWYWENELKIDLEKMGGKNHGAIIAKRMKNNARKAHLIFLLTNNVSQQRLKEVNEATVKYEKTHTPSEFGFELGMYVASLDNTTRSEVQQQIKPNAMIGTYRVEFRIDFFKWHEQFHNSQEEDQKSDAVIKWIKNISDSKLLECTEKLGTTEKSVYFRGINILDPNEIRYAALHDENILNFLALAAGIISLDK